jgi:hypothetical protein
MTPTATPSPTHARPCRNAPHVSSALAAHQLQRAPQLAVLAQANLSLSSVLALLHG